MMKIPANRTIRLQPIALLAVLLWSGVALPHAAQAQVSSTGDVIPVQSPNPSATWDLAGMGLLVGFSGTGALNIVGGGLVLDSTATAGSLGGSLGTVVVNSGTWSSSGNLTLGSLGVGTIQIGDDSRVENLIGTLGAAVGGSGTATVTGGRWVNFDELRVGDSGSGSLSISGGLVGNSIGNIARGAGSTGTALVSGGTWNNATLLVVGNQGTGSLTVSGAGQVVAPEVELGRQGTGAGTLNLNGGTLATGNVIESAGSGTVALNGGMLQLTANQGALFNGFENGDVSIAGGGAIIDTQTFTATTALGLTGTGALTKLGSGTLVLTGSNSHLGGTTVGNGTLVVDGGRINHAGADTILGASGGDNATLEIKNGGQVSSFRGLIGYAAGSTGNVIVSSGTWSNSSPADTSALFVGYNGSGTMTINGGHVVNAGDGIISAASGASGSVFVSSGTWENQDDLMVGQAGTGNLTVNGGYVSNDGRGIVGFGGVGNATVSSGTWNTAVLTVGSTNQGNVIVSGGLLNTGAVVLGSAAGSVGSLTVSGSSGGRGVMAATQIREMSGTGTLALDGGVLRAKANQSNFLLNFEAGDVTIASGGAFIDSNGFSIGIGAVLSGSGALTKIGSGTLTLSGSNGYSGGTVVSAGTLIIADAGASASALGTGDVDIEAGGKLSGIGTVLGDAAVAGTLSPGNSPGELHFAGALLMEGTATIQMELASLSSFDEFAVDGLLTYDGTLEIILLGGYDPHVGDSFVLFDAASVAPGSAFDDISFSVGGYEGTMDYGTGILTITTVPEPGTCALAGMGLVTVFGVAARRSRKARHRQ